jgi:DNA-binding GntR family transcriptional regulator
MARECMAPVNIALYPKNVPPMAMATRTFEILRDQIMAFRLKPYEVISEKGMSEALGVSRTPPICKKSQFLHEALEVALAARAAESLRRGELVRELMDELALQEALLSISDDARFFKSDEQFHQHIATFGGFPGIRAHIGAAKLHMDRFRHLTFPRMDSMAVVIDQHRAIAAAIECGQVGATEAAMRTHLRRIYSVLGRVRERYPQYFVDPDIGQSAATPLGSMETST